MPTRARFECNICTCAKFNNSSSTSNTDISSISNNSSYSISCPAKIDLIASSDHTVNKVAISQLSIDQSTISKSTY
jgi:hypothetical protein